MNEQHFEALKLEIRNKKGSISKIILKTVVYGALLTAIFFAMILFSLGFNDIEWDVFALFVFCGFLLFTLGTSFMMSSNRRARYQGSIEQAVRTTFPEITWTRSSTSLSIMGYKDHQSGLREFWIYRYKDNTLQTYLPEY